MIESKIRMTQSIYHNQKTTYTNPPSSSSKMTHSSVLPKSHKEIWDNKLMFSSQIHLVSSLRCRKCWANPKIKVSPVLITSLQQLTHQMNLSLIVRISFRMKIRKKILLTPLVLSIKYLKQLRLRCGVRWQMQNAVLKI